MIQLTSQEQKFLDKYPPSKIKKEMWEYFSGFKLMTEMSDEATVELSGYPN